MAEPNQGTSSRSGSNLKRHRVVLMKGEHCWKIRWDSGEEDLLVAVVSDLAADEQIEFDWFDAAMVRHQVANIQPDESEHHD